MKWASLGFPTWKFLFCLNSGLGTAFCMKRRCLLETGLVEILPLVVLPFLRELAFGLAVSLLVAFFCSLSKLPGGLPRIIPGELGPHLSRLRHFGWLQCGHGLTCRPMESSMPDCVGAVLGLLGYPAGSVANLANGNLKT